MPDFTAPDRRADQPGAEELLRAVFEVSLSAINLLHPLYAADGADLVDFAFDYLNPAAQRLMDLPERPGGTVQSHQPDALANGVLAFYRQVFETGEPGHYDLHYQAEGFDNYFQVAARRHGEQLVVSFIDTAHHPRTAVENALRKSQAREQAARTEAEVERNLLQALLTQAPVAISLFQGPELRITAANAQMAAFWGRTTDQVVGQPLLEALPELRGQGFDEQLTQVLATQVPVTGTETPAQMQRDGHLQTTYYNFVYQPLYNAQGQVLGVLDVAVEVTEQVRARQQVQQLNEELEMRVLACSTEARAAQHEAEQQREQARVQQALLGKILGQVPAAIATLAGPEHRYTFFNDEYQALSAGRTVLGLKVAEVFPEVAEQGFIALLDQVYATGRPFTGTDVPAMLHDRATGQAAHRYVDFIYQPLFDGQQEPRGILAFIVDVTDKVRARKQADTLQAAMMAVMKRQGQERENVFQLFEQAPGAICLLREPEHRIDYLNPAYQALFPGQVLRGHTLAEVQPDNPALVALFDAIYQEGQAQFRSEVPVQVPQLGGRPPLTRYFDFTYQAYREQGRIAGVSIFGFDVTERVRSRQAVEATARQLRILTDSLPVLIGYLDREKRYRFTNRAYEAWFNQPADALLGRPVREVIGEAAYQVAQGYMDRALADERVEFSVRMPYREGFVRHIHTDYIPDVQAGEVLGFYTLVTDVTAQVEAREQLEAQQAELQRIFARAPVAIAILRGPDLIIELANAAVETIWGRTAVQVLGQPYFKALPETAGQGFEQILAEVLQTGQSFFVTEAPVQLPRAHTGQPMQGYVNFVFQPLFDEQQRTTGLMAIGIEVTDQVLARQQVQTLNEELAAINQEMQATNEELNRANTRLTRTNADLDTFVYTASHDLKAPISNIEGLLLALRHDLPTEVMQSALVPRLLDLMQGSVARFQQTIGHLTDISQLQQPEAAETVDLTAVVKGVRLDLAPLIEAAAATLTVAVAGCQAVRVAPKTLRSVVYNLLSNAVKYRAPNRLAQVELRASCTPGRLVLEVQDNGLGLTETQQNQLFGMFRRLHTHVEGSGVGLFMVKRLIENAGGTIAVQSQAGVGTTFIVSLPA